MKNKILVCEGNFSATLAAVRSFGRHGLRVVVADNISMPMSKFSKYTFQSVKCPDVRDEKNFISWILKSAGKGNFDVFFPTSDVLMWYTLKYNETLRRYMKIKIPYKKALEIALFKDLTYKYCKKFKIPAPTTYYPHSKHELIELAGNIKYPVLIKHRTHACLNNDRKGYVVWNKKELLKTYELSKLSDLDLDQKYKYVTWPIVQEFIHNTMNEVYNVSGFSNDRFDIVCITSDKKIRQRPTKIGVGVCVMNFFDEELIELASRFIKKIQYNGIFSIEFIRDEKENLFKLIDFNPRAHAFMQLDIDKGMDVPWLWYESITKNVIPFKNPKINVDRYYCNLTSDFINFPSQLLIRKNKINTMVEYLKTWSRARSFADLDLYDISPFFINMLTEFKDVFLHPRAFIRNTIKGE